MAENQEINKIDEAAIDGDDEQISAEEAERRRLFSAVLRCAIEKGLPFIDDQHAFEKMIENEMVDEGVKDIIPKRESILNIVGNQYFCHWPSIEKELLESSFFGIVADMYTVSFGQQFFVSLTAQYVNNNDKLIERIVGVKVFDADDRLRDFVDVENIKFEIDRMLGQARIEVGKCIIVSRGLNAKLNATIRYPGPGPVVRHFLCTALILDDILSAACTISPKFREFCVKSDALHKYLQSLPIKNWDVADSNTSYSLLHHDNYEPDSKWTTKLYQLQTTISKLKIVLRNKARKENTIIHEITADALNEVIEYLLPFIMGLSNVCSALKPTLHLCYPIYHRLLVHTEPRANDSDFMKEMKQNCYKLIRTKWRNKLKLEHAAATFLYPPSKQLATFRYEKKQAIHDFVQDFFRIIKDPREKMPLKRDVPLIKELAEAAADIDSDGPTTGIAYEMKKYINEPPIPEMDDVCKYWGDRKLIYPCLHEVFVALARIPATAASRTRCNVFGNNLISTRNEPLTMLQIRQWFTLQSHLRLYPDIEISTDDDHDFVVFQ